MELSRLSVGDSGDTVARLHEVLVLHGVEVSPEERKRRFFGPSTREAVREFQRTHHITTSGEVDAHTASAMNAAIAALNPQKPQFTVSTPNAAGASQLARVAAPLTPEMVKPGEPILHSIQGKPGKPIDNQPVSAVTQPPVTNPRSGSTRLNSAMLGKSVLDHLNSDADSKAFMEETLNAALKSRLSNAFADSGASSLVRVVQAMGPVDIAANKDVSVRTFVAKQVQSKVRRNTILKKAIDPEVEQLSDKTTIGNLLGLNQPIKDHPQFQNEVQKIALGSLLAISPAIANTQLQERFISLYAGHDGPIEDFWSKLGEQPEFKAPGTIENLQFILQIGALTQYNLPLVQALQGLHQQGTLQSVRDLTRLDTNAWANLINTQSNGISIPSFIPGATREEQVANYVGIIINALKRAFPTSYVAQDVARQPEIDLKLVKSIVAQNPSMNLFSALPGSLKLAGISAADQEKAKASLEALRREVRMFPGLDYTTLLSTDGTSVFQSPLRQATSQFFANAPDFDFRDTHIDTYLVQNAATALKGIDDQYKDAVPTQLKLMQRLFQISPRYESMSALLGEGIHSAHRITRIPQASFVRRFQDKLGGEALARAIYAKANSVTAMTTTLYSQYSRAFNNVSPQAFGNLEDIFSAIPNYTELFGSLDLCDCEHCHSVYSPAAYLVDLLQFLYNAAPNDNNETPLDVLTRRRADLKYIRLNCVNTETPMPYIDLVNEIMESYVVFHNALPNVPGTALPNPKDTSPNATAEELSVNPENTDVDAYKPLQDDAVFPQILPFSRSLEVVRAYLEYLGSSRYQVMNTFKNNGVPLDRAIDSEYLKISAEEYKIFTGKDFKGTDVSAAHSLWEFYGYSSSTVDCVNALDNSISSRPWEYCLAQVPEFLRQSGIDYLDLIELLKTRFLNPHQSVDPGKALTLVAPADVDCDLNKTMISNLNDGDLKKIHRFIRLWRKLGWQIRDLDRVITALGSGDIDVSFLQNLARVRQLQTDLNLPLVQLLSFWTNIDTDGDDSLYNKLFQNKAVLNPADPDFTLSSDGSGLLKVGEKISSHMPTILGALRISAAQLSVLTTNVVTDDALNLENLSMLYRHTVLARALNLSIADLLSLKTLIGINPFTDTPPRPAGSPTTASQFLENVRKVRQSSFSVAQLDYLYRQLYDPKRGIAPLQRNVDQLLQNLQTGLKKIAGDTALMPDPSGEILRQKLAIALDSNLVNTAIALIDGSAVYITSLDNKPTVTFPDSVKDKISYDDKNKKLRYTGNMIATDETSLLTLPGGDGNYKNAISDLFQQPRDFLTKNAAAFLNPTEAIKHLIEDEPFQVGGKPPTKEEKITYVLTPLMAYLRVSLSQNLIKQKLSEALKLDTAMIDLLLGSVLPPVASLVLKSLTNPSKYAMADFLALLDNGLSVTYFANKNLDPTTGTSVTRIDPINFNWDTRSPDPAISGSIFSARWTGRILAQYSETYTFTTHTNNGLQLWVDNQLLISDWKDQPATDHSATIALKAGQLYDIRMEYYNDSAGAVAELWWSSPSTSKMIIPQTQFFPSSTFAAFALLHKVALLVNSFKMTVQEVAYLSVHGTNIPGFDFNALPLNSSGFSVALFAQWEQLYDLFTLRDNLPSGEVGLIDVFEAASFDELKKKLSAATSWDPVVIDDLSGSSGFNLTTIDQFKKIEMLIQLRACIVLSRRLGVSVAQLFSWATQEPDAPQALEVKNTVKAKFDDEQWLTVGKTLNDKLRDSQKAALIAYILQMPDIKKAGITDSSRLYEYFLIDVDMTSCMMTSRIKQAISSVQLFVQRCLLNEETNVDISSIDIDLWNWMKHYRVWEANRKVFLYPENWIEPELRDDKSPFFKELEAELLQKDITPDNVEQALLNYLEKLDEVSRLEICGMYWECEPLVDTNILHVFGRTFTIPHVYYYRQLIKATTWTAWEKVQVNIEGDHLIPIIWNRRLHIFWPIFTEKSDDQKIAPPSLTKQGDSQVLTTDTSAPKKHWEIKIAWSEYKQNKWSPKQVSADTEIMKVPEPEKYYLSDRKQFFVFKALIDQWTGELVIRAYLYNKYVHPQGFYIVGEFHLTGCRGRVDIIPFDCVNVVEYDLVTPKNCEVSNMTFQDTFVKGRANPLTLVTGNFGNDQFVMKNTQTDFLTLDLTPSSYNLLYPHQFLQFAAQAPFFFQDSQRTYFVTPEWDKPVPIFITRLDKNLLADLSLIPARGEPAIFDRGTSTTDVEMRVAASANREHALVDSRAQMIMSGAPKAAIGATREPIEVDSTTQATMSEALQAITIAPSSLEACMAETQTPSCDAWGRSQSDMVVTKLKFATHYHPYVCTFIKALNRYGIPGLLNLFIQEYGITGDTLDFTSKYYPVPTDVDTDYPKQNVDFSPGGAYSLYNWELFFHIPLLIATKLSKNQRFEEAQHWFHYIFNPTDSSLDAWPKRLWRFFPFYNNTDKDKILDLLALLDYKDDDPIKLKRKCEMIKQVLDWQHHPFDPHRIARLRMIAYQKNVFMKYIDNLIAWGDQLFRQDTIETINEATQLYILAYELLGPRPENIPPAGTVTEKTYTDLQYLLDKFSNALVNLENHFPFSTMPSSSGTGSPGASDGQGLGTTFYFCIPKNDKLLGYWDVVADRLFKIRHCMNIEGVVRQLPLFEPPIDPALLVQATAMGIDLNSALNDINAATPFYRFTYILQKALELCAEVRGLGAALLSALEKKDAEALAAIRANQETTILKAVRLAKEQQLVEAQANLDGINKTREVTNIRFTFYHTIEARSPFEIGQIAELTLAQIFQEISQQHELGASIAHLIPNFDLGLSGFGGSPLATASFGGANVAGALEAIGRQFGSISSMHTFMANMASILGGWDRRAQEWSLQENLAAKELEQIDKQIAAANVRIAIAQLELDNHDKQIENAQAIEDFLRDKYTSQDLYDWMMGQVSTVYKQCYQMAYDLAKRAEKTYRFERGITTSAFITFGYWDSLKRGLLSGEQLYLDLKRLEMAYIDQNKREYEIAKHISLVLFDPMALITLKECGTCLVNLPEALFDMDYPGHYMRRIKSVSLTIPCVAGPYTSINCTLTLLSNQIRKNADLPGADPYSGPKDDADALARFITTFGAVESIATSTAQNDSGMFEVNFRDERYLPFEGAGVVSTWRIDMPKDCNAFDFETISDVIIRLNYTAREGGARLCEEAKKVALLPTPVTQGITTCDTHFPDQLNLTRMFSAKHEFSSDWYRFLHPADITTDQQVLSIDLTQERFPFQFRGRQIDINSIKIFLKLNDKVFYNDDLIFVLRKEDSRDSSQINDYPGTFKAAESPICKLPYAELFKDQAETIGKWKWSIVVASTDVSNLQSDPANPPSPSLKQTVKVNGKDYVRLNADAIADIWILCDYTAIMTVSKLNG